MAPIQEQELEIEHIKQQLSEEEWNLYSCSIERIIRSKAKENGLKAKPEEITKFLKTERHYLDTKSKVTNIRMNQPCIL
jgi:hypothetical protein